MPISWWSRLPLWGEDRAHAALLRPSDPAERPVLTHAPYSPRLQRLTLTTVLVFGAVFGTGFLTPTVGPGLVPADLFILSILVFWLVRLPEGEPRRVLPAFVPPVALIFAGSMLGSLMVGLRPWIVTDLIKDAASFASFLAMVTILRAGGAPTWKAASWASTLATVLVTGLLLMEVGTRAQATFANPNIAGHFLVTNLVIATRSLLPKWIRYGTLGIGIIGLVATGSFGGLIMALSAFGYLVASMPAAKRRQIVQRVAMAGVVLLAVAMIGSDGGAMFLDIETGFNERHFARSSEGRLGKWTAALEVAVDNPLGVGPGSNSALGLLPGEQEAHSEYIAYLSERSLLGLTGLILLYLALWRMGPHGGLTRALTIGFALQSIVRETFHYRHLWLLLALGLVLDERDAVARR